MSLFSERRKRLLEESNGREVVVARPENLFYLTDFYGSGVGVVRNDKTLLITSRLEEFRARKLANEAEVHVVEKWRNLEKEVKKFVLGNAVTDSKLKGKEFKLEQELFRRVRAVKDKEEVSRIRKASQIIDKIYKLLEKEIRAGVTEFELAALAMREALKNGATTNGFDSSLSPLIVASGPNGSYPHAELTNRKVREGDSVVCDISLRYKGYNSDATRTFFVSRVSEEQKNAYKAVLDAQQEGLSNCTQNTKCSTVSIRTREVLKNYGLLEYLNHGVGHGVGIEIHELPSISNESKEVLRNNNVVTVEPGVYFAGKFGVRIEDTVLVSERTEVLHKYTKEMVVL